jgi:hypothetical protein
VRAQEFLQQIKREQIEIKSLQEQIDTAEASLLPKAIRYDLDKVQTSPEDPMYAVLAEVEEYKREMMIRVQRLTARRNIALKLISRLKSTQQRQVLFLYYLDPGLLSMQQVADKMVYSEREAWRKHNAAMKRLANVSVNVRQHL